MTEMIEIAFGLSNQFLDVARVAMESILRCNTRQVRFWIVVSESANNDQFSAIESQLEGRATLKIVYADQRVDRLPLPKDPRMARLSAATYYRLIMPQLVQHYCSRVIYLDADVLCVGDLWDLWEVPLNGRPVGAVRDGYIPKLGSAGMVPCAPHTVDPSAACFNSGVLVIDVEKWLAEDVTLGCIEYLNSCPNLRYPDQDALNLVLLDRWTRLEPKWNEMRTWRFEPSQMSKRASDSRILHFAGPEKPWLDNFPEGDRRRLYRSLMDLVQHGER